MAHIFHFPLEEGRRLQTVAPILPPKTRAAAQDADSEGAYPR